MNPPSIRRAVSSQTVRVSSSMETAQQAQVDLQPEIGANAQKRGVERDIHAVHDRRDHRLDFVGVGGAAGLCRREGNDQAESLVLLQYRKQAPPKTCYHDSQSRNMSMLRVDRFVTCR